MSELVTASMTVDGETITATMDVVSGGGGGSGTVTSVAVSGSDGLEVDSGSPITSSGTIALGVNASTLKTFLSLNNVENTALSTWAGTSSITTLGTITTGTWTGSIIAPAYLGTGSSISTKYLRGDGTWQTLSGGGDAATSANLDQFADVTQTAGQTLAITSSTTLSGGTHSGTNTGDNATNSQYSGLVSNATHTGDVTGSTALTIAATGVAAGTYGTTGGTIPEITVNAKGQITSATSYPVVPGDGTVSLAKLANLAQDQFIGRVTASTGVPETATITAAARTVLDDTTVAAMVNTLGGATSTGTGGIVRATSPTFVTPNLGTPASGTISTGVVIPWEIIIACSDETTALTAGTAKASFRMPWAATLTALTASVKTDPQGSSLIVDVNENGTTVMGTHASQYKLIIETTEKTSTTAAGTNVATITDSALAADAEITIDIDAVGASVAGAGLKVTLKGFRTI
jgi:hypothetical protein